MSDFASSLASQDRATQNSTFPSPQTPPLSIVLYVLCNNLQSVSHPTTPSNSPAGMHSEAADSASRTSQEERMECLRTIKAFSELLESEDVPAFTRERIVLQVGLFKKTKRSELGTPLSVSLHTCM